MAVLFQKDSDTIGLHIKNVYQDAELQEYGTTEKNSVVQKEGSRNVKREVNFYNLDVIISVGYRVNSIQGTHFRIWATRQLREFMIKGFLIDDEKLKGTKSNYFDELYDRVRSIRISEKNFWQKIKDIFAFGSIDFESDSEIAKTFFATVQNMFHYAIHEHTAQELIKERDQFLSFAELQSVEKRAMYMSTWVAKLIEFLKLNEKPILQDAGKVSKSIGEQIALSEFQKFEEIRKEERQKLKKFLDKNAVDIAPEA